MEKVNVDSKEFKVREEEVASANELLFTLDSSLLREKTKNYNYLLGRILTVVDALTMQEVQRKAVKDLIHSAFEEFRGREQILAGFLFNRISEALAGQDRIEVSDGPGDNNPLPSLV
jgi:hypothetical protein